MMISKGTNLVKIFCFVLFLLTISAYGGEPELTPSQIDMGQVKNQATATFMLHNKTEAPIVITRANSDCSCTKVKFTERPIMAGDSTKVVIKYNPAKDEVGTFYKTVFVYTSHSDKSVNAVIRGKNY